MDMTVHAEVQAAEQTVNGLQSEGNISLPSRRSMSPRRTCARRRARCRSPTSLLRSSAKGFCRTGRHRAQGQAEGAHAWSGRGPTSLSGAHAAGRGG
jgi:hypothetical protein